MIDPRTLETAEEAHEAFVIISEDALIRYYGGEFTRGQVADAVGAPRPAFWGQKLRPADVANAMAHNSHIQTNPVTGATTVTANRATRRASKKAAAHTANSQKNKSSLS